MNLVLPLKREYFEAIKAGTKLEEYRLCTPYWAKRIEGKTYSEIVLTLGYPKRNDSSKRIVRKWKQSPWIIKVLVHSHFGPDPVTVYAIDVR